MPLTVGTQRDEKRPLTGYAIMGLLEPDRPYTAVDIERRARQLIRFFYWPPAISHIRRELNRLEGLGYVHAEEFRLGRVKRSLGYRLTPEGSAALEAWTEHSPAEPPVMKNSVILRLWLGRRAGDGRFVLNALESHVQFLSAERADLEASIRASEESYATRFGSAAPKRGSVMNAGPKEQKSPDAVARMRAEWHLTVLRHCLRTLDFEIDELQSLNRALRGLVFPSEPRGRASRTS